MIFQFKDKIPSYGSETYIARSAEIIGDVIIGNNCYVGPGAKIRGDYGIIRIGNRTSIQENCVIHARAGGSCAIGNNVIVGHAAILHGPVIEDNVIIGMGAIISDDVLIKSWCIIGAGALVPSRQTFDQESLVIGVPAKIKRKLMEKDRMMIQTSANVYAQLSSQYLKDLKELSDQ
ncbi:MAG: gamma carbonic anhydrase family protein [Candidatus Hodarchaeota archaeon]